MDLVTPSITALFTITVFVIGQLIDSIWIKSIQKQKDVIAKIGVSTTQYANLFPWKDKEGKVLNIKEMELAYDDLRVLASELRATTITIPYYKVISLLGLVLKKDIVKEISKNLIGWGNTLYHEDPKDRRHFIKKINEILDMNWD